MTEQTTPKTRGPRKSKIETPGQDEVAQGNASHEEIQQQIADSAPLPQSESFAEQITEEVAQGNAVQHQSNNGPQIGDRWAGMVLTEHGWQASNNTQ